MLILLFCFEFEDLQFSFNELFLNLVRFGIWFVQTLSTVNIFGLVWLSFLLKQPLDLLHAKVTCFWPSLLTLLEMTADMHGLTLKLRPCFSATPPYSIPAFIKTVLNETKRNCGLRSYTNLQND